MGGVDSEVTDDTRRIVLEAANFDMKSVRRTARALKLRTDASARFERGLDPNLARDAAARATRLILELSPGRRVSAVADVYPQPLTPRPLSLPFAEIERLLGIRYEPEQVLDVLSRLGFSPELDGEGDAATLRLIVPTWRSDVTLAADVVEEVARVIGYETLPERLPIGRPPRSSATRSTPCNGPCARSSPAPAAGRRSPTSPSATRTCVAWTPTASSPLASIRSTCRR